MTMSEIGQVRGAVIRMQGLESMEGILTLFLCLRIAIWVSSILLTILLATIGTVGPGVLQEDRVVSVCLYMLLKILRALKRFATEFASMWFQWNVDSDV